MSKKMRNWLIALGCVLAIILLMVFLPDKANDFREKYEGADLSADVGDIGRADTYAGYLRLHADVPNGEEVVCLDERSFTGDGAVCADGVMIEDGGVTTWNVHLEKAGMYTICLDYLTTESRGVDIERAVYINGELPFSGADTIRFSRLWTDSGEPGKDNQGNDIRPTQVEIFDWQTAYCRDDVGYELDPYLFFFDEGDSTLTLEAVNEPVIIGGIRLVPAKQYLTYEEYAANAPAAEMTEEGRKYLGVVQGESALLRSTPSLYARYDRSSPSTEPYSVRNTVLNFIGGDSWNEAGEWIEWEIEVPEDGFYNLSVKARQPYQRGAISCRSVYIDGEIPFEELKVVSFTYDTAWKLYTLSDSEGTPFRLYLTAGKHTVRLEATLGVMGEILNRVEDSIFRLNQIYRKVLIVTGVNPDAYRDYNIDKLYPDVFVAMDLESKRLYKLVDDIVGITGQMSDRAASVQTLARQLENFVKHNDRLTRSFVNFKDNITALGTAMQNMSETKLDIDLLIVSGEEAELPKVRDGGIYKIIHEIRSCVASYFVDYNSLGDKYEEDADDLVQVWIVTGRDQSTILKTMIDDTFTPMTGIKVNVKLVAADAILGAVVAGNGPDVVLSVDSWFAANYAMRHAVEDLTQFEDFGEVTSVFYPSALTSMSYDDGTGMGVFGLPETQLYPVLFYRKDIMEQLNLDVPETWDELIGMLPTIQGNNMSVGIPYPDIVNVDTSVLNSLIYQNGGRIYDDDAKRTLIDSEAAVKAFKFYTGLFNDYGLPTVFDFVSRFRSGEMPLGVASYNTFNTLSVSAPEIRGLWDFTLLPGTETATGEIDHSAHCSGACCMIIATDDETVKNNAWRFLKWWVSTDSQVRFGREMESVLGASARYATANTEALRKLAWSGKQLEILSGQQSRTVGFREVAGGYSTARHMTNAIRRVINTKEDPRETLLTYVRTINEEIKVKRREFNLPLE